MGIDRHSKAIVVRESEILGDLFINMFDLRRIQLAHPTEDSYTISEIADVEHTVDQCAIAMIYKLNDAAFRPLFLRMSDWAKSTKSKSEQRSTNLKQTAWYTFLLQFFDSLKVSHSRELFLLSANDTCSVYCYKLFRTYN